jgi:hypothetical protein
MFWELLSLPENKGVVTLAKQEIRLSAAELLPVLNSQPSILKPGIALLFATSYKMNPNPKDIGEITLHREILVRYN